MWSLSDLWNDFFPNPNKGFSTLADEEKLEFEFWELLDCPSDCFPSQTAREKYIKIGDIKVIGRNQLTKQLNQSTLTKSMYEAK